MELLLRRRRLGPEGAFAVADRAMREPVESIDLGGNAIGPYGARAFVPVIRASRTLVELDLSENGVGDQVGAELVDALECNRVLTKLVIGELNPALQRRLNGLLCRNVNAAPRRRRTKIEVPAATSTTVPTEAEHGFTQLEMDACLKVLDALSMRRKAASTFPQVKEKMARALRVDRAQPSPTKPRAEPKPRKRPCYVCKQHFPEEGSRCPACAALDGDKRHATADLTGRVALVTGGRIKIGRQIVLKLLRAGASVIATTRFPHDAAKRYETEPDFESFAGRLRIEELDLLHLMRVEQLAERLAGEPRLDVLINNAAQTIYRPPAFYAGMMQAASEGGSEGTARAGPEDRPTTVEDALQLIEDARLFPAGSDDGHGQPLDLRSRNSWRMRIDEIGTRELLSANLVNAIAPYLLIARLRTLMARTEGDKFVINVSAVEGQFARENKTWYHPHTNMAKAALNMLTRTSAEDLARDRIYLNSVDPGWFSNQNPHPIAEGMKAAGFAPPIDEVDGAARVLDPIFTRLNGGDAIYGLFLKDYRPAAW